MSSSESESDFEQTGSPRRRPPGMVETDVTPEFTFNPALVTLVASDPPPETISVRQNTILTPPSEGFFVFATCIFHAGIVPEGTVILTKRCPNNLRIIAKNNVGSPEGTYRRFIDIMPTIMRNNKTAEDILKESMMTCLSELNSTCKAFEAAAAPESAYPDKFAKLKSEVKLKCSELKERIKGVGVNGLTELRTPKPKTQTEQLAILFNAHEKGNALTNVVYYGTILTLNDSVLNKTKRLNTEHSMCQHSGIDYGVPKKRYMPTKRYYLNQPIDFMRRGDALDDFIDNLYCHLHLAVGLRFEGESYTAQLDVNLRALKAIDPITPNTITMDEVVKLLVSPTLAHRVVDLVCEKYRKLNATVNKGKLITLSKKKDTWQMALFDHACSDIHMEGYPELLHTGPNGVVLSTKAHGSRPQHTQTVRFGKMKKYIPREMSDELFTTILKKRKREDSSSSDESITTAPPKTPKQDFTDEEGHSSSGGSKRRHRTQRTRCRRHQRKLTRKH